MVGPFGAIVPTMEFPPTVRFTVQVTVAEGLPVPVVIVAVKSCAAEVKTVAEVGSTLIAMLSCKATETEALSFGLTCATAVTVTLEPGGRIVGAVNRPAAEIVPVVAPPPATPFTSHVTFVFASPVTVAWNVCVWPRKRLAVVG